MKLTTLLTHTLCLGTILSMTACLQDRSAPIEYHGDQFYGKDATYNRRDGTQLPRYSNRNRAVMPENQDSKYIDDSQHQYGIEAPVAEIGASDLPPLEEVPAASPAKEQETLEWKQEEVLHPSQLRSVELPETTEEQAKPVDKSVLPQSWGEAWQEETPTEEEPAALVSAEDERKAEIERMTRMAEQELQAETAAVTAEESQAQESQAEPEPVAPAIKPEVSPAPKPTEFVYPLRGDVIKSFNETNGQGITIAGRSGEPVRAAANGTVLHVGGGVQEYGTVIIIQHLDGYITTYGHLGDTVVSKGDEVMQGQLVGFVGKSGNATTPQLHFSIRSGTKALDPSPMLQK